jgi:hypothetical protein
MTLKSIKQHIKQTDLLGHTVNDLHPEFLLAYLVLHGNKHGWIHLEQLCCIAELLRKEQDINWTLLFEIADEWECLPIPRPLFPLYYLLPIQTVTYYFHTAHKTANMKIMHVTWGFANGGTENLIVDLANEQSKSASVSVLIINDTIADSLLDALNKKIQVFKINRKRLSLAICDIYWALCCYGLYNATYELIRILHRYISLLQRHFEPYLSNKPELKNRQSWSVPLLLLKGVEKYLQISSKINKLIQKIPKNVFASNSLSLRHKQLIFATPFITSKSTIQERLTKNNKAAIYW